MNAIKLSLCTAALVLSAASNAGGIRAVDVPRITNGGTGFIGVTESVDMPRQTFMRKASWDDRASLRAGEASTLINGQPNANPDLPSATAEAGDATRTMGAQAASYELQQPRGFVHPTLGTPK